MHHSSGVQCVANAVVLIVLEQKYAAAMINSVLYIYQNCPSRNFSAQIANYPKEHAPLKNPPKNIISKSFAYYFQHTMI